MSAISRIVSGLVDEGLPAIESFLVKNIDNPQASAPVRGAVAQILKSFSGVGSDLGKLARPSHPLSDLGSESSAFIANKLAQSGGDVLSLTTKDLPRELRKLGLKAVPGLNYANLKLATKDETPAALRAMRNNVEALLAMGGDRQFYWDGNKLIEAAAPSVSGPLRGLTFAPFSMGSDVPTNVRLWSRFMENPELFAGRMAGEGSRTAGNAQQKALSILLKDNPTIFDLTSGGNVGKIGSFAENLIDPATSMRATIDTHAFKIPTGVYSDAPLNLTDAQYRTLEKVYQDVAAGQGILPHEVQSGTWDSWRRLMHKTGEDSMLNPADFQRLNVSPLFDLSPATREQAIRAMADPAFVKRMFG